MDRIRLKTELIKKEWLPILSVISLIITSIYIKKLPIYSFSDIEILFILFVLFVVIKGVENSGFFLKTTNILKDVKRVPLLLIVFTFFLSMFVTNDVALLIMVPITLTLVICKKDVIIILEALAANAGSAFTPFGNPQNLFIYWYYKIKPLEFFRVIAPFSLIFLVILIVMALLIKVKYTHNVTSNVGKLKYTSYVYLAFLLVFILVILKILPIYTGFGILIFSLIFDRKSLKIDYGLIITFLCFFGASNNLKIILYDDLKIHSHNLFFLSAGISQLISNVPATLLLARFTKDWKSLLWGVNTGGFGSTIGSLANLIAFRLYTLSEDKTKVSTMKFTVKFLVMGIISFLVGCGLFLIFKNYL